MSWCQTYNGDGVWGNHATDVNQADVNDIRVRENHHINQFQVLNNTLFVGIGSSTADGGVSLAQSVPGETAYTLLLTGQREFQDYFAGRTD